MRINPVRFLSIGVLAVLLQGHTTASAQEKSGPVNPTGIVAPTNINVDEAEKLLLKDKKIVILDVRTPEEYQKVRLAGATNINFTAPDFEQKVAALDKSRTYLVHCAVGGRSAKACAKMSRLRFKSLYNLEGGIKAWEKAGKKVER
ncbi:MAG: rhodanese-like domain-containing protein [Limisphaerales bacterium]